MTGRAVEARVRRVGRGRLGVADVAGLGALGVTLHAVAGPLVEGVTAVAAVERVAVGAQRPGVAARLAPAGRVHRVGAPLERLGIAAGRHRQRDHRPAEDAACRRRGTAPPRLSEKLAHGVYRSSRGLGGPKSASKRPTP